MFVWNWSILGCPLPQKFALPGKMGGVNSRSCSHKYPIESISSITFMTLITVDCLFPHKFTLPGKMGGVNSRSCSHKYPIRLMRFLVIRVEP